MYNDVYTHIEAFMYIRNLQCEILREGASKGDLVSFVASTANADRYGDVINQGGWDLSKYKQNPVILLNHNANSLPIGKGVVDVVDGQLMVDVEFDMDDPQAKEVARKTKERSIALQAREAAAAAAKKKKKGAAAARRSKKGPPKKRKQRGKDKGEGVSGAEDNSARDVSQHKKKMKVNQESSMQPLPQISDEARAKAMAAAAEEARARTTLILSLARHGDRTDTSNGKEGKPVC